MFVTHCIGTFLGIASCAHNAIVQHGVARVDTKYLIKYAETGLVTDASTPGHHCTPADRPGVGKIWIFWTRHHRFINSQKCNAVPTTKIRYEEILMRVGLSRKQHPLQQRQVTKLAAKKQK